MVTMRATLASVREAALVSVADPDRPGRNGSRVAAKRLIGAVDVLHREPGRRPLLETAAGRVPAPPAASRRIPRHSRADRGDVVAVAGADRNRRHRQAAQAPAQQVKAGDDAVENVLVEADQVHLIDRENDDRMPSNEAIAA